MKKTIALQLTKLDLNLNNDGYKIQYSILKENIKELENKGITQFACLGHSFAWATKIINEERREAKIPLIPILPISGRTIDKKTYKSLPIMSSRNRVLLREMLVNHTITPDLLLTQKIGLYDMSHEGIGLKGFLKEIHYWIKEKIEPEKQEIALKNLIVLTFQPSKDRENDLPPLFAPFEMIKFKLNTSESTKFNEITLEKKLEEVCDSDTLRLFPSNKINTEHFTKQTSSPAKLIKTALALKETIIKNQIY